MLCQESIKKPEGFGLVISRHFEKVHRAHLEQELLLEPSDSGVKQEPLDEGHDHFSDLLNDDDGGGADDHDHVGGDDVAGLKSSRSKVWKYFDKVEKDFSKW